MRRSFHDLENADIINHCHINMEKKFVKSKQFQEMEKMIDYKISAE